MTCQPELSDDDIIWALDLARTMITTAITVASSDDDDARPVYEAARQHALSVNTSDGRGADRWLAAMLFIAAHASGFASVVARHENSTAEQVWQQRLLRAQS